ncbi:hypothetical protein B0T10DRAFT_464319 [Thelonectria olida]|uniref:Uncharacterized protein n=1 Tax=Thelonectria olida TaxID=1576542 RepID=A0A9P8VV98_9HYPO|nr:hypothetical protein B0T10DRAFT_464319 [Thelonectria olida]
MNGPALSELPSGSHGHTLSPPELFQGCLQERKREESIENERLRRELQHLKDEVTNTATIVSWQQRLAALGEVHIRLLENFIARLQDQPLDPRLIESEQTPSCGQSIYTPSSWFVAEDSLSESNQLASGTSLAQGQDENDARTRQAQGTASGEWWSPLH